MFTTSHSGSRVTWDVNRYAWPCEAPKKSKDEYTAHASASMSKIALFTPRGVCLAIKKVVVHRSCDHSLLFLSNMALKSARSFNVSRSFLTTSWLTTG